MSFSCPIQYSVFVEYGMFLLLYDCSIIGIVTLSVIQISKPFTFFTTVVLFMIVSSVLEAVIIPTPQPRLTAVILVSVTVPLPLTTGLRGAAAVHLQLLLGQQLALAPLAWQWGVTHSGIQNY